MLDVAKAAEHVKDSPVFELPWGLEIHIPQPPEILGYRFTVTKFMVLELAVAVVMLAAFIPLARKMANGTPVRGRLWNLLEMMLVYIRDEMVRPAIGRHDADRFLPFLWTVFFFILLCNLMGLLPWAGSPTGSLAVTATLAAMTFCVVVGAGMFKFGPVRFWLGLAPRMDLSPAISLFLKPMILVIEILSLLIKHMILAVRLLANVFAGHLVLAVILLFTVMFPGSWAWYGVMPVSVFGAAALCLLELLVAFLQAYIFTFLSALFIGMAVHQH